MASDVPDSAIKALASFIRSASTLTGLTVLEEWPEANLKLTYPSLTISTVKPKRMPCMPYEISRTDPDVDLKILANEVVATWDFSVQLDLWTRTKPERKDLTDKIVALFNSQENGFSAQGSSSPDGLTLAMGAEQFAELCRYEIDTIECLDDELAAERRERREMIMVLANCREVRQRSYYAMTTVEIHHQATTQPVVADDSNTEVITVQ